MLDAGCIRVGAGGRRPPLSPPERMIASTDNMEDDMPITDVRYAVGSLDAAGKALLARTA